MNREKILEKVYNLAFENERKYRGCTQSVLAAIQDVFSIRDDQVFKSGSGLAGGVGLSTLGTCGALTGGAMGISQIFGRKRGEFADPERKRMIAYRLCDKLTRKFVEKYGSVICGEIHERYLGRRYNLWNREDYEDFDKVAYQQLKCPELVGLAAVWAAEIILDALEEGMDHGGILKNFENIENED